jgi:tetratricopeptide (TPR) repeat protein
VLHLLFPGHPGAGTPAPLLPGVSVTDFAGPDEAMAWFTAERPALLAGLRLAAELGLDRQLCHLARALFVFLHRRGRWHERAETQRAAVAAAHRLGDPAEETFAHRNLAGALADLGHFDDAHRNLDIALERSRADPAGQAWTHYHRDLVYVTQGREAEALSAARRAHALFEEAGDEVGRAVALTDLGWYHGRLGDHELGLELCEQALILHQKLGNRPHEGHAWWCLAEIHFRRGDPAAALPCHRQALDLFREVGDLYAEASTLAHLGACHHVAGERAAADEHWRQALVLLGDLDRSTTDQIHAQLRTLVDEPTADAFLRRSVGTRRGGC